LEGPQASSFCHLVRAACRWRCAWSFGRMMLTGETEVLGEKPVPVNSSLS
jgi:hypothetical protein